MPFTASDGSVITGADPTPVPPAPPTPDRVFTLEELNQAREEARTQEKSKLYKNVESLQAELASVRQLAEQATAAEAARQAEAQRLVDEANASAKAKADSETDLRELLARNQREMEEQLSALRAEAQQKEVLLQREQEYRQLIEYREQQKAAHVDDIIPDLLDLVDGGTPQEIDSSIARLAEKSAAILELAKAAATQARASQRGASPTGAPAAGPLDTYSEQTTYSAEDIAAMSMNDYIKNRGKFGLGGQGDRGIFR